MCDYSTDANFIAQLAMDNQTNEVIFGNEEDKEIQDKPLLSTLETVMHIHEFQRLFEGHCNLEDSIFV